MYLSRQFYKCSVTCTSAIISVILSILEIRRKRDQVYGNSIKERASAVEKNQEA